MRRRGMRKPADCAADQFEDEELKDNLPPNARTSRPSAELGRLVEPLALELFGAQAVPSVERVERVVVRHVAAQGRDRDAARLDGRVVRPVLAARAVILLADPVVSLAARVYVLGDDGASLLDALPRHLHA